MCKFFFSKSCKIIINLSNTPRLSNKSNTFLHHIIIPTSNILPTFRRCMKFYIIKHTFRNRSIPSIPVINTSRNNLNPKRSFTYSRHSYFCIRIIKHSTIKDFNIHIFCRMFDISSENINRSES